MRARSTLIRGMLTLLLVGSAVLFFAGSTSERSHHHNESAAATPAEGSSGETGGATGGKTGGETGGKSSPESTKTSEATHAEAGTKLLGIDTESLALSLVAVGLSLLAGAAILARTGEKLVLPAVAVLGLVFAAADARELVHQLDDSNGGLAAVAAVLIGLHLAIALLAGTLALTIGRGRDAPDAVPKLS